MPQGDRSVLARSLIGTYWRLGAGGRLTKTFYILRGSAGPIIIVATSSPAAAQVRRAARTGVCCGG